jgi:hypothetical protein
MMTAGEFRELMADLQGNGLRIPITLFEGKILDGRNRYKACKQIGIVPEFRDFNGDGDPVEFIVSMNLRRRNLTESQKGLVGAKIASLERGRPKETAKSPAKEAEKNPPRGGFTEAEAAKAVDTSERTVSRAKKVLREAPKSEIKAIEQGKKTLGEVEKQVDKSKKETKETHLDKTGYPIPNAIIDEWKRAEAFSDVVGLITKVKSAVNSGLEDKDVVFAEINNTVIATLTNAYNDLKRVIPFAVCTTCQGRTPKKCTTCKGRGFLSKFYYQTCVPQETKSIREKAIRK